jgi:hypothetical protein
LSRDASSDVLPRPADAWLPFGFITWLNHKRSFVSRQTQRTPTIRARCSGISRSTTGSPSRVKASGGVERALVAFLLSADE